VSVGRCLGSLCGFGERETERVAIAPVAWLRGHPDDAAGREGATCWAADCRQEPRAETRTDGKAPIGHTSVDVLDFRR